MSDWGHNSSGSSCIFGSLDDLEHPAAKDAQDAEKEQASERMPTAAQKSAFITARELEHISGNLAAGAWLKYIPAHLSSSPGLTSSTRAVILAVKQQRTRTGSQSLPGMRHYLEAIGSFRVVIPDSDSMLLTIAMLSLYEFTTGNDFQACCQHISGLSSPILANPRRWSSSEVAVSLLYVNKSIHFDMAVFAGIPSPYGRFRDILQKNLASPSTLIQLLCTQVLSTNTLQTRQYGLISILQIPTHQTPGPLRSLLIKHLLNCLDWWLLFVK